MRVGKGEMQKRGMRRRKDEEKREGESERGKEKIPVVVSARRVIPYPGEPPASGPAFL